MGLMSLLSANCGTVSQGRFSGCKLSMGTDSGKVIDATAPNQFIFIKGFNEVARVKIADEVKAYDLQEHMSGATLKIEWTNGESSLISMSLQPATNGADPRRLIVQVRRSLETYFTGNM